MQRWVTRKSLHRNTTNLSPRTLKEFHPTAEGSPRPAAYPGFIEKEFPYAERVPLMGSLANERFVIVERSECNAFSVVNCGWNITWSWSEKRRTNPRLWNVTLSAYQFVGKGVSAIVADRVGGTKRCGLPVRGWRRVQLPNAVDKADRRLTRGPEGGWHRFVSPMIIGGRLSAAICD